MRAMILAAGRGERLRPYTDTVPKPLLPVRGQPLIAYHLQKLAAQGVHQVIINHAWLGAQIEQQLGDGSQFGLQLCYSAEPEGGLETAGGIIKALPFFADEPFWVINGDVYTELDFAELPTELAVDSDAHLLMVTNPEHHPHGDFAIANGRLQPKSALTQSYTYSGLGLFHPRLFADYSPGSEVRLPLRPLFEQAIAQQRIAATWCQAAWTDVGTPERWQALTRTA